MKKLSFPSCFVGMAALLTIFTSTARPQNAPTDGEPKHYVFAHYMLCFGSTVEFYKQEMELAQRHGIDGFALNAGDWLGGDGKPGNYVISAERMYQAAKELNSGFKLFFSPDMNGLGNLPVNIGDMVSRFKDHPNQMRHAGKVVLSGWGGVPATYIEAITKITAGGTDVVFVPFVYNPRYSANWSAESVNNFFEGQPHMDGVFYFGADAIFPEIIRTNAVSRQVAQARGKLFMAGVSPAYNSPNLRDFHGMEGYDAMWKGLMRDNADWVEIVTWNDYNEDSNLMPFQWPAGDRKSHNSRDEAFLDLTAYYSAWYKTGVRPTITQDKLYYGYRNRSKYLTKGWDDTKKEWADITKGEGIVDQIHDDVHDSVYVTTFLTAPATLTVSLGKATKTFAMSAGISHVGMPMQPGVPRFSLNRANKLIEVFGRKLIIDKETEENSLRGYHLQNRTWSGAAAAGVMTRLEAESGQLSEGATLVKDGAVTATQNLQKDNSGVLIPIKNLKSGTYNVRVVYSNPAATEARLTLSADGPPRAEGELPYLIPAFLPPTAKGQYATTSFFWSLYDTTSFLKLAWVAGLVFGQPSPINDDKGSVLIDAIELIPVAPVQMPAARNITQTASVQAAPVAPTAAIVAEFNTTPPVLVSIPGGTFTMGRETDNKDGAPDEQPPHVVTLSPFAIGETEITNAQYEKYDPGHSALRDEFSRNDSDPVIYVSWNDCAKYCNWLSQQQGLTPVYDEKTWQADVKASGYRLPSEAQWEYIASGRGENRKYPWGNEAPDARRGNFLLSEPGSAALPSGFIGNGTMPVGTFPAGASRDGILDMAGNAAEWCADYYAPYATITQTDPLNETASNYRVIRGGSWGYYNFSQRAADREFNNAGYPGYIYIGFRVALLR